MTKDSDPNVVIQAMLTLNLHKVPQYSQLHSRDGGRRARREA